MVRAFRESRTDRYRQVLELEGGFGSFPDEPWEFGAGAGEAAETSESATILWNGTEQPDRDYPHLLTNAQIDGYAQLDERTWVVAPDAAGSTTASGQNLRDAYAAAKAAITAGLVASATQRLRILILPGTYELTATFELDTSFIDIEGTGEARSQLGKYITRDASGQVQSTAYSAAYIQSPLVQILNAAAPGTANEGVFHLDAADIRLSRMGIFGSHAARLFCIYADTVALDTSACVFKDMHFKIGTGLDAILGGIYCETGINFQGYLEQCHSRGTLVTCVDVPSYHARFCTAGGSGFSNCSGVLEHCIAAGDGASYSGFSGLARNCVGATTVSFETLTGTAIHCEAVRFGGVATASTGRLIRCIGILGYTTDGGPHSVTILGHRAVQDATRPAGLTGLIAFCDINTNNAGTPAITVEAGAIVMNNRLKADTGSFAIGAAAAAAITVGGNTFHGAGGRYHANVTATQQYLDGKVDSLTVEGTLDHNGANVGFYGVAPTTRPTALTGANAGTLNTGDATSDTVIGNMRTRIGELETKLQALGLLT